MKKFISLINAKRLIEFICFYEPLKDIAIYIIYEYSTGILNYFTVKYFFFSKFVKIIYFLFILLIALKDFPLDT